jgi:hypothetical protein
VAPETGLLRTYPEREKGPASLGAVERTSTGPTDPQAPFAMQIKASRSEAIV